MEGLEGQSQIGFGLSGQIGLRIQKVVGGSR